MTSNALIVGFLLLAAGVTWAGGQHGVELAGIPLFSWCAAAAFALNWIAFVPSYARATERYFDLVGSLTYLVLVAMALLGGPADPRSLLLGGLIALWALRLGAFLFARILRSGSDPRFDALRSSGLRFLMTWTLQGLWVLLTTACALAAMTSERPVPPGPETVTGVAIWGAGLLIEAVADAQKSRFRADPANRGRFIDSGLWAWSRHPNYLGEIVLWVGIALIAWPALSGWQHLTLISPLFVYLLLTRVSGIPLLEARARERWGDDPEFRDYMARTPPLVPRWPSRR